MRDRPPGLYSCQSIAVLLPTRRLVSSASEQGWPSPPALSPLPRACRVVIARNMGLPRALCRSRPGEVFQHRVARRLAAEAHSAWCGCRNQPQLCCLGSRLAQLSPHFFRSRNKSEWRSKRPAPPFARLRCEPAVRLSDIIGCLHALQMCGLRLSVGLAVNCIQRPPDNQL